MQVLDRGTLGLVDWMGSDRRIAEAAWVSYGKQDSEKPIDGVINYMMKHKHGTPFEHVVFTFHVKAPIFVAREWLRHRIGSFNEISGRYVQFEPEFYVPEQFRIKGTTNKQGSIDPPEEWLDANQWYDINDFNTQMAADLTSAYSRVYDSYIELLESGVANEQARMVLPVGLYTQFYWTVNLRALFNFLNLRTAENAQWEIRQYAEAIEQIVAEKVPVAYEAWLSNEKVAP
jgi:thymidylate synthase (FAD)